MNSPQIDLIVSLIHQWGNLRDKVTICWTLHPINTALILLFKINLNQLVGGQFLALEWVYVRSSWLFYLECVWTRGLDSDTGLHSLIPCLLRIYFSSLNLWCRQRWRWFEWWLHSWWNLYPNDFTLCILWSYSISLESVVCLFWEKIELCTPGCHKHTTPIFWLLTPLEHCQS